ncbi:hypothetical protein WA026_020845 [Henosepilachna vigintioctopunctata]|uniref:Uncharacterized protein n=1 Tax=Henosepilachna vigintioctopunctata TaxID=420089 RepID=A0AAW1TXJ4_9CUCU
MEPTDSAAQFISKVEILAQQIKNPDCIAPKKPKQKSENNENSQGSAFLIEKCEEIEALITKSDFTWILESVASSHMIPHLEFFTRFQETSDSTVQHIIKRFGLADSNGLKQTQMYVSLILNMQQPKKQLPIRN